MLTTAEEINKCLGKISDQNKLSQEEREDFFYLAATYIDLATRRYESSPEKERKLKEWFDKELEGASKNIKKALKQFKKEFLQNK